MRSMNTGRGTGSARAHGHGSLAGDSVPRHCAGKMLRDTRGPDPWGAGSLPEPDSVSGCQGGVGVGFSVG